MEKVKYNITEESAVIKFAELCKTTPDELIKFVYSLMDKYNLKPSDFERSA